MIILNHMGKRFLSHPVAHLRAECDISGKIYLLCIPVCKYIYIVVEEQQVSVIPWTVLVTNVQIAPLVYDPLHSVLYGAHISAAVVIQKCDYGRRRYYLYICLTINHRNLDLSAKLTVGYQYVCYILIITHELSLEDYVDELCGKFRFHRIRIKEFIVYDCQVIAHISLKYHLLHETLNGRDKIPVHRLLILLVHDDICIYICQLLVRQNVLVTEISEYSLRYLIVVVFVHAPDKAFIQTNILEILVRCVTVISVITRIVHLILDQYSTNGIQSRPVMPYIVYLLKHLKCLLVKILLSRSSLDKLHDDIL